MLERTKDSGRRLFAVLLGLLFTWAVMGEAARQVQGEAGSRATGESVSQPLSREAAARLFADTIAPLVQRKCLGCHGEGDELEGGLDLRTRAGMLKGGDSGAAVVPGEPEKSLLLKAVRGDDDVSAMPPKETERLTVAEIDAMARWIAAGAPWPADSTARPGSAADSASATSWQDAVDGDVTVPTSGGLTPEWTNRKYKAADLWAFRPIRRPAVPLSQSDASGTAHPIDAFINRKLAEADLEPAPEADRRTLIRRATWDLTGLPPTPEEIEAFVNDDSPQAWERLVERLLDSPHYGERMAQHWLDVVRYADTAGYANDFERPHAWRYRDYVIRSFNQDKPFDRFVIEQLAGDELDPTDPDCLIATSFLRMGPWEHTGMSVARETRQLWLDDITNAVGETFFAQGLRCARCHDHKFDPIPTRDYYRLQAVFAPVQFADRRLAFQPTENLAGFTAGLERAKAHLKEAKDFLAALEAKRQKALQELLRRYGVKREKDLPPEIQRRHIGLSRLDLSLEKIYRKRLSYFEREVKRYEPWVMSVYNGPWVVYLSNKTYHPLPPEDERQGKVQEIRILSRGSLDQPLEAVTPGVLSALPGSLDSAQPTAWNTIPQSANGRRLALARWMARPENPLTARVIVNRVWQMHFGRGIVATSNNFGKMGKRPTHPELLDWLAVWFVEHDWSIKKLHRLIMTSATYRRSGMPTDPKRLRERDPANELLAVFPPRRLSAEELRDGMLAVTGELNPEMGGPPAFPEIHWEVALQPRHIMGSVAPAYQPSPTPAERHRRTIYAFRCRTLADPLLEVFNRPGTEISCERRDETTVTPQVFALFNGQFVHDRALALAHRLMQETSDPEARITRAFRLVYGRDPTADERQLARRHVQRMTEHHRRHTPVRVEPPRTVVREMVEELTGEPYSWEEPLDQMKDFVPDLKPWDVDAATRGLAELCLVLFNSNEWLYVR